MDDSIRTAILNALNPGLRSELTKEEPTPLTAWFRGEYVPSVDVLAYASTFGREDGYTIVRTMAVVSLIETALLARPIDVAEHEPLWRCFSLQQIPADLALSKDLISSSDRPMVRRLPLLDDYALLTLTRTDSLDTEGQRVAFQRAQDTSDPLKTAIASFAYDLAASEMGPTADTATRWAERWSQRFESDTDAGIFAFRAYASSAKRTGASAALRSLNDSPLASVPLSVRDAAWALAWTEAAEARAHDRCAHLALDRAGQLDPSSHAHMRWVIIYALHRERVSGAPTHEPPVARELLDLFYHKEIASTAGILALSIASRSSRLDPVLREALPVLQTPISTVLRAAYAYIDRQADLTKLIETDAAGALVALRMLQSPDIQGRIPHQNAPIHFPLSRATPPPMPVLDDYETNPDLLVEPSVDDAIPRFGDSMRGRHQPSPFTGPRDHNADEKAPAIATPHLGETQAIVEAYALPAETTDAAILSAGTTTPSEETAFPEETTENLAARRETSSSPNATRSTLPHLPPRRTPFASGSFTPAANAEEYEPLTDLDVLLAINLPDDSRPRADQVLASRILNAPRAIDELLATLDEHALALPESVRAVAQKLRQQGDLRRAVLFYEHAARAENQRDRRSRLYYELGELWRRGLSNDERSLEYYIVSFTCDAANYLALSALRDIYREKRRYQDLLGLYRVALQHARQNDDLPRVQTLEEELLGLQTQLTQMAQNAPPASSEDTT